MFCKADSNTRSLALLWYDAFVECLNDQARKTAPMPMSWMSGSGRVSRTRIWVTCNWKLALRIVAPYYLLSTPNQLPEISAF